MPDLKSDFFLIFVRHDYFRTTDYTDGTDKTQA
jgi:hypothetical protein